MTMPSVSGKSLALVLIALVAMLVFRSWLQLQLIAGGMQNDLAQHVSYLLAVPALLVLVAPLWRSDGDFLLTQYQRSGINLRVILIGIGIGLVIRIAWWAQLFAGTAFGIYRSSDPNAIVGPEFVLQCPSWQILLGGIAALAVVVPFVEEVIHRGYIVNWLRNRGFAVSCLVSAFLFAIFHNYSSWETAFTIGLLFALIYWRTESLWPTTLAHSSYNLASRFDWGCIRGNWNPIEEQIPVLFVGVPATIAFAIAVVAIFVLISKFPNQAPGSAR